MMHNFLHLAFHKKEKQQQLKHQNITKTVVLPLMANHLRWYRDQFYKEV